MAPSSRPAPLGTLDSRSTFWFLVTVAGTPVAVGCGDDGPSLVVDDETAFDSSASDAETGTVDASASTAAMDTGSDTSGGTGEHVCGDGLITGDEGCDDGEANGQTECNEWCQVSGSILGRLGSAEEANIRRALSVVHAGAGHLFVLPDHRGHHLWSVREDESGSLFAAEGEGLFTLDETMDARGAFDLGLDRLAVVGRTGRYDHAVQVWNVANASDSFIESTWTWGTEYPSSGWLTDMVSPEGQRWFLGYTENEHFDEPRLWIWRVDSQTLEPLEHLSFQWYGGARPLEPRGAVDRTTGRVVIGHSPVGLNGGAVRMSVHEPATGQRMFFGTDGEHDQIVDLCPRPNGGVVAMARTAETPTVDAIGYQVASDGSLEQDGVATLDFGPFSFMYGCATGSDTIVFHGRIGNASAVIAMGDPFEDGEAILWQHSGPLGEVAQAVTYREGRYYVALGDIASRRVVDLVVFAE